MQQFQSLNIIFNILFMGLNSHHFFVGYAKFNSIGYLNCHTDRSYNCCSQDATYFSRLIKHSGYINRSLNNVKQSYHA